MSQQNIVTDTRHNDFVGNDANKHRIPGADKATTGHHFVTVFPKEGPTQATDTEPRRPEEHLPPPTGRDRPPRGVHEPIIPAEPGSFGERLTTARGPDQHQPQPLAPAPDSRTVIDRDPFATPVTAADTMTGATSADVHRGIGHPGVGMSSKEIHHDGGNRRTKNRQGTDQYGTVNVAGTDRVDGNEVDMSGFHAA